MKSKIIILLAAFLLANENLYSQQTDVVFKGLYFEIGGGIGNLRWAEIHSSTVGNYSWEAPSLRPTVRIGYKTSLSANLSISGFCGYNQLGGMNTTVENDLQSDIKFHTIEIGTILSYPIEYLSLSLGAKYNRFISATLTGTRSSPVPGPGQEFTEDVSGNFTKGSLSIGPLLSFSYGHFRVSFEAWFGITDMSSGIYKDAMTIKESHYRMLFGYCL